MFRSRTHAFVVALLLAPAAAHAGLTASEWRADLRTLDSALVTIHREPFRHVTRESLARAVADLDASIPSLAPHEVVLGMARVVAMLRDGHTRLSLPEGAGWATDYAHLPTPPPRDSTLVFHHLPVRFWDYGDGLGVREVLPGSEELLGAKLLRIESAPAESLLARVAPFVSRDNAEGLRFIGAARLSCVEVLRAAGIAPRRDRVRLELRTRDGRTRRVTLAAVPARGLPGWIGFSPALRAERLADRHGDRPFWIAPVAGHDALLVRHNQVTDTDSLRFVEFAQRLAQAIARERPGRVILDLRANTGGDGQLLRSLVASLVRAPALDRHGALFVLTGRRTFSAAQTLVNQLEQWTEALFVGEPTGTTPSHHGDNRRIVLPRSGLTLRVSTVYWRDWTANASRAATTPDLPAPMSLADDLDGRDPALEAALAFRPREGLVAQVDDMIARGGRNAAIRRILRATWDPRFTKAGVDSAIARLGR